MLNKALRHEDVLRGGSIAPCVLDFSTWRRRRRR